VIFLFNNKMLQGNRFGSAVQPTLQYYVQLAKIMVAMLLVCLVVGSRGEITRREIQPWTEIAGAQSDSNLRYLLAQVNSPFGSDYITLRRPTSISARGNDIYLLDAGLRQILRYANFQQTLTPFATLLSVEAGVGIYIAPDMPVYATDPAHEQVLHFNWDDTPFPSLVSRGNMAYPDSVVVNEHNGHLLVIDSLPDQMIAFRSLGMTLSAIKPRPFPTVATMTAGPEGIYVANRLAKLIVISEWGGSFCDTFGGDPLSKPDTIAVSRDNIAFINDDFNNTISFHRRLGAIGNNPVLADKIADGRVATDSFNTIGLAAVDGKLCVTDSMNPRGQIMLIDPRAPDARNII
jgi:hypothetical protein